MADARTALAAHRPDKPDRAAQERDMRAYGFGAMHVDASAHGSTTPRPAMSHGAIAATRHIAITAIRRSQSARSRPGARRSTTAPRLAHPLEHHPCFRAVIGAAPAIADLARELREEGRDLVGTLAIACGASRDGFASPPDSRARMMRTPRLDGRPLHRSRSDRRKDQSPRAVAHSDARAASD